MLFAKKLDKILKDKKVSSRKLSEDLEKFYNYKISKESIAKYRTSERTPDPEFIEYTCKLLNIEPNELFIENFKPVKPIPIVGSVSCGNPDLNHFQEYDRVCLYNGDRWSESLYCVVANGDSMAPEIEDGDELVCDPEASILDGDLVHYQIAGKVPLKSM